MHGQCPTGKDSWCKYKQALCDGKVYVDKTERLSNSVIKVTKPTYLALCDKELLKKCLQGETQSKHNSLLHEDSNRNSAFLINFNANCKQDTDNIVKGSVVQQEVSNTELDAVNTMLSSTSVNNAKCVSILSTAKVLLYNNEGGSFLFRALLDIGFESSFISKNATNILGLKKCNDRLSLSGISGIQERATRNSVGLKIGLKFCEDQLTIIAYILNKVTSQIPIERVNIKELDYLKSIPLVDEDFSRPSECDVILSFFFLFCEMAGSLGLDDNLSLKVQSLAGL
ncbi:DUF1758 domain-containing protein [Trichonephila clavipes]|nr:DUF1758 domain-containing protein [Trichonephila clavipes]